MCESHIRTDWAQTQLCEAQILSVDARWQCCPACPTQLVSRGRPLGYLFFYLNLSSLIMLLLLFPGHTLATNLF